MTKGKTAKKRRMRNTTSDPSVTHIAVKVLPNDQTPTPVNVRVIRGDQTPQFINVKVKKPVARKATSSRRK